MRISAMKWKKTAMRRKKENAPKDRTNKKLDKKQEKTAKVFLRAAALEVKIVGRFDAGFCRRRGMVCCCGGFAPFGGEGVQIGKTA